MPRKWGSLAAAALLCWIFGAYQVRSQTHPAGASGPSTKPAPPAEAERILHFHAEIAVHDDSSLTVTESIRIVVLGKAIRRGICPDFPVRYRGEDGSRVVVPFEIVAVLKNGEPEPYHIVNQGRYRRVYIGRKDIYLKPGVYTYTLVYRMGKQLIFKDDKCKLYWNVTGNEWTFEIAQASARVKPPKGVAADKVRYTAYTGPKDAKGKAWKGRIDRGGRVCFATTSKLKGGEGLTISVTWSDESATQPNVPATQPNESTTQPGKE